ncbi:sodium/calcium transporter [Aspergillus sclerotiicarbonarius CBS 121057]|uniref:Sodium/calcium transporter n=1 Tax=Aspergillus sclerotiicarbonarius (strain CBS 121057 / IBT 28362) TaxID=1448318 RepID=A0A319EP22_ASPSB|nr:sodium/calcium transporter [Aspergillus sclerotiicarbonarius CBS 121057]
MDWDTLCFNTATFIAGIFILDYGADKFLDHTVIVGRRLRISPTLIALLTAGAEYEELTVVIAAILQHRSPLALGNVLGATISNILGAFSLGLLCHASGVPFDRSAKIYSVLLLLITTLFVALAFFNQLNRVTGGILIAIFTIYIICTGYAIYKGVADPPEMSDSDSDSDTDGDIPTADSRPVSEVSPLLGENAKPHPSQPLSLHHHIFHLVIGLLALSLSGYILAHSAASIADSLQLSDTVFGLTVIAFATTLPEKLISVMSGLRGQGGIVVATTAGSNIFLLTLCVGVVAVAGGLRNQADGDNFVLFELFMVWVSAVGFTGVVFLGPSRGAGLVLLAGYIVFLGLEVTVYRR